MEEKIKNQAILSSIIYKPIKSEAKGMKIYFHMAMCDHTFKTFMQFWTPRCPDDIRN